MTHQGKFGRGVVQILMGRSSDQVDLFNACGVSIDDLPAMPLCLLQCVDGVVDDGAVRQERMARECESDSRDVEQPSSLTATSQGVVPHLSMNVFIARDDFIVKHMLLIADDESSVHHNVANGRAVECEDDDW